MANHTTSTVIMVNTYMYDLDSPKPFPTSMYHENTGPQDSFDCEMPFHIDQLYNLFMAASQIQVSTSKWHSEPFFWTGLGIAANVFHADTSICL